MGITSSQLPAYSGPHSVGIHDVEVSLSKPEVFGTSLLSAETGEHAFQLETVLFSLFYPCTPSSSSSSPISYPYWLERPISAMTAGYTRFANRTPSNRIYAYILVCLNWFIGARLVIPAIESAELKRREDGKKWPVIVFSHGLAGNRKCYSQYCGEMASRGYIVAVMEHRDGTAPYTRVLSRDSTIQRDLQWIDPKALHWKDGSKLTSLQVRAEQLTMRVSEIEKALDVLKDINSSEPIKNLRQGDQPDMDWSAWSDSMQVDKNVIMAGHSFGAATTIETLKDSRFGDTFKQGICLDPWVDPIGQGVATESPEDTKPDASMSSERKSGLRVPIIVQNSQAFTDWRDHFKKVRDLVLANKAAGTSYLITIHNTAHISFSDFLLLLPTWYSWYAQRFRGSIKTPKRDMDTVVQASLEFMDHSQDGERPLLEGRSTESSSPSTVHVPV